MSQDSVVTVIPTVIPAVVPTLADTLGKVGRMTAFFFTAGFAYPNVMTEGMDLAKARKAATPSQ